MQEDTRNRNATAVGQFQMEVETGALVRADGSTIYSPVLLLLLLCGMCVVCARHGLIHSSFYVYCFFSRFATIRLLGCRNVGEKVLMGLGVIDPGRGRYPVPDADPKGGVAVWQVKDGWGE